MQHGPPNEKQTNEASGRRGSLSKVTRLDRKDLNSCPDLKVPRMLVCCDSHHAQLFATSGRCYASDPMPEETKAQGDYYFDFLGHTES